MKRILVTGASGQIGIELVTRLRLRHGSDAVVEADLSVRDPASTLPQIAFDVRDSEAFDRAVTDHKIGTVYHLASLLSAKGEQLPDLSWDVNLGSLKTVLGLAHEHGLRVFWPSSIAVFGPSTPRVDTPQQTLLEPTTMYGVTKLAGEHLCHYYHLRYGVDVRSLRYPGLISYAAPPGGGTTDYAIEMLAAAAAHQSYTCFLKEDTRLPMMYMPDAIEAVLQLMSVPSERISVRTSYNVSAFSFTPSELEQLIRKTHPAFLCTYQPDQRQAIAESWPQSIHDALAQQDWGWAPAFSLEAMVADMFKNMPQERPADAS